MSDRITLKHILNKKNELVETDVSFSLSRIIFRFNNNYIWYNSIKSVEMQPDKDSGEKSFKLIFNGYRNDKPIYEITFDDYDEMHGLYEKVLSVLKDRKEKEID